MIRKFLCWSAYPENDSVCCASGTGFKCSVSLKTISCPASYYSEGLWKLSAAVMLDRQHCLSSAWNFLLFNSCFFRRFLNEGFKVQVGRCRHNSWMTCFVLTLFSSLQMTLDKVHSLLPSSCFFHFPLLVLQQPNTPAEAGTPNQDWHLQRRLQNANAVCMCSKTALLACCSLWIDAANSLLSLNTLNE